LEGLSSLRIALLAALFCAHAARADAPRPWAVGVSPQKQADALRIFKIANTLFEESHHTEALARYKEALALWDHPSIRYNIAVCLVHLDQPLAAFEHLEAALRYGEAALGADVQHQALTYRKLLLGQLASLTVRASEAGAEVFLDGERVFTAPGSVERLMTPGVHQLVATKRGFMTATQSPTLLPGKTTDLEMRLVPLGSLTRTARRWPSWKPWVVFGTGLLVAAIGVPLLLDGRAAQASFANAIDGNPLCSSGCTAAQLSLAIDAHNRGQAEQIAGYAMFGAGGAALATGIVLLIVNQPRVVSADRGQLAFHF
jgi:hypothetical protein